MIEAYYHIYSEDNESNIIVVGKEFFDMETVVADGSTDDNPNVPNCYYYEILDAMKNIGYYGSCDSEFELESLEQVPDIIEDMAKQGFKLFEKKDMIEDIMLRWYHN